MKKQKIGSRRSFFRQLGTLTAALGTGFSGLAVSETRGVHSSSHGPEITWKRRVPVRYETDVAVLGGGIAGVCAALAAARSGAKVLLAEHFAVTGGNATTGGVASFCGETAGQGEAFDAIIEGLESWNAIEPYRPYPEADNRKFNHEILAVVLQELLLRRGVKLLLHTSFADINEKSGEITEALLCGPSGPEALRAKQFIDCTGEAQVVHQAGFETAKGRPEDGLPLPMSLMFFVRHAPEQALKKEVPEGWFEPIRSEAELPMTSVWPNGVNGSALKIKIPKFDAADTESMTAAEIRARRRMMEVLDYYQRIERKPWLFDHCSPRIGIREGRRIIGEYVLTVEDLRAGRRFDDAIARGVYALDGHKPDDDQRTYLLPPEQRVVPPYQIPWRCLWPKDAKNLLAAGRCLSADQLALSSARVMTTCAMMGQAAGVAAAMAARRGCTLNRLVPAEIQNTLLERNASLAI